MIRTFILALPLVAFSTVADAQNFRAENRVVVQPVGASSFAVPLPSKYGARGTWCAAADYAEDVLGQRGTARIYVQQARSAQNRNTIFGLDPAGAQPSAVVSTGAALRQPGSNLSIDHAKQFCRIFTANDN